MNKEDDACYIQIRTMQEIIEVQKKMQKFRRTAFIILLGAFLIAGISLIVTKTKPDFWILPIPIFI